MKLSTKPLGAEGQSAGESCLYSLLCLCLKQDSGGVAQTCFILKIPSITSSWVIKPEQLLNHCSGAQAVCCSQLCTIINTEHFYCARGSNKDLKLAIKGT